ncbi:MAG: BBP7 family outer membrane beta-barrel protein, partial [Gemmataceae bacterium]
MLKKAWLSLAGCLLLAGTGLAQPMYVDTDEPANAPRFYFSADYLMWWIKDAPVPVPLVVTGGSPANQSPQIGVPGVVTLIGGNDVENQLRHGGRFTAGYWLDQAGSLGFEGSYFFLGSRTVSQRVSSNAAPGALLLTLPFFDATLPGESSTRIALPGGFQGTAVLSIDSRLQGYEANGLINMVDRSRCRLDFLLGFRYLDLDENLSFTTDSTSVFPPADIFRTLDSFSTSNEFYGGQFGVKLRHQRGRVSFGSTMKVAFGSMHETVQILGGLATNDFNNLGPVQLFPAGYLTAPTNIGKQTEDRFAVIPQIDLNVGFDVTSFARLLVGYSFLYVSDV